MIRLADAANRFTMVDAVETKTISRMNKLAVYDVRQVHPAKMRLQGISAANPVFKRVILALAAKVLLSGIMTRLMVFVSSFSTVAVVGTKIVSHRVVNVSSGVAPYKVHSKLVMLYDKQNILLNFRCMHSAENNRTMSRELSSMVLRPADWLLLRVWLRWLSRKRKQFR